mmetsp:Transcript_10866/g.27956  ORF Transcript_10866/g.27956 Transcript_10866/m.27956 type:complete len:139 (+) Transcript_10866:2215-2631(+)
MSLWRGHLGHWLAGYTDGPMPVSDLVRIIKRALAAEPGGRRGYQIEESMKQRLRLLDDLEAKGGALRHAGARPLQPARRPAAQPPGAATRTQSGTWQVFELLLSQNVIDPRAPFADSGAGEEGRRGGGGGRGRLPRLH